MVLSSCRAMRGEFDTGASDQDTEKNADGKILGAMVQWPAPWTFQVVAKDDGKILDDVRRVIESTLELTLLDKEVSSKPRMGGKYTSISITTTVRAPELVYKVYAKLEGDARIKMKF